MPAVRLSRRRRSSLAISYQPAKAGIYGIPRPVTFAPNVTPVSYVDPEDPSASEPASPSSSLFPPSEVPHAPCTRRRAPPGKRRSLGYIPRPPNAFMLFRADFVRQKHVPGSIETNHGSLSKIIGNCWRSLPLEDKKVWELKAKHAKAEHKVLYPEYRFRPVHNKNKDKKKDKPATTVEDERRCEEVAQLLLEGKKGDELAAAVRTLDQMRTDSPGAAYRHRRSSSVPLPNDYYPHYHSAITVPSAPFLTLSRPSSPVRSISRQQRNVLGYRRSSSARPATRSWTMPFPSSLQRDDSPLPEVDTSLFERSFLEAANTNFSFPVQDNTSISPYNVNDFTTPLPPHVQHPIQHEQSNLGPLDSLSPHDILSQHVYNTASSYSSPLPELDPVNWIPIDPALQSGGTSQPSTAYTGSPTSSDDPLPVVHAPQPQVPNHTQNATVFKDMWKEFGGGSFSVAQHFPSAAMDTTELELNFNQMGCNNADNMPSFAPSGLDSLFEPHPFESGYGYSFDDMVIVNQ